MTETIKVGVAGVGTEPWCRALQDAASMCGVGVQIRKLPVAGGKLGLVEIEGRQVSRDRAVTTRPENLDGVVLAPWRADGLRHIAGAAQRGPAEQVAAVLDRRQPVLLVPPVLMSSMELAACGRRAEDQGCGLVVGYIHQLLLEWVETALKNRRIGDLKHVSATCSSTGRSSMRDELAMLLMAVLAPLRGEGHCDTAVAGAGTLRAKLTLDGGVTVDLNVTPSPRLPELRFTGTDGGIIARLGSDEFSPSSRCLVLHTRLGEIADGPDWSLHDLRTEVAQRWLTEIVDGVARVDDVTQVDGFPRVDHELALRAAELAEQVVDRSAMPH